MEQEVRRRRGSDELRTMERTSRNWGQGVYQRGGGFSSALRWAFSAMEADQVWASRTTPSSLEVMSGARGMRRRTYHKSSTWPKIKHTLSARG